MRAFLVAFAACLASLASTSVLAAPAARPNILWISCEDICPNLGCYGDGRAITPRIDRLASQGVRYTNAFTTAGVCAPSRSTIITGIYATTLGSGNMRSVARLPREVRCFPAYLRQAGYYCTNNRKTDYNFAAPRDTWDRSGPRAHWRHRRPGQPFFAVFNLEVTHEGQIRAPAALHARNTARLKPAERQNPDSLTPPPYHPETPAVRRDWARYYELITALDYQVGDLLDELRHDGLDNDTIVFFWSDNGCGLPRMKRWVYDSGTHVCLTVRIPKRFRVDGQGEPGSVDDQLVSFIDLAPTVLNLAGVPIPPAMQGRAFLGPNLAEPREYVFAARDRMDERYDLIRTVRDRRYRYVRNYMPFAPYAQYIEYNEQMPTMRELRRLHAAGQLPPVPEAFFRPAKPVEELYDLAADPHEIHNLADDPRYAAVLDRMRRAHETWMVDTKDLGLLPEAELERRGAELGSQWAILRQPGAEDLIDRLRRAAGACAQGEAGRPALLAALGDPDPAVRWWAATGLGTLTCDTPGLDDRKEILTALRAALSDAFPTVRVAAATALCRHGRLDEAIPVLTRALTAEQSAVRLQAILALDELGPRAAPALEAIREATRDTKNPYVARAARHALGQLEPSEAAE